MEEARTGTGNNSEANSTISHVNETDINEISKEKEDELLFGAEEDGDDEGTLSDDSLRLRLSDDEEQEYITRNHTNISEFKSQSRETEQSVVGVIIEKKLCYDPEQIAEEATKSDSGKPVKGGEEFNTAIKALEHSALPLDECTSNENKRNQNNTQNPENSSVTISNESNEKCIFKSNKDLKIIGVSKTCPNATSEQHVKLGNDYLSTNNHIQLRNNLRNAELKTQNENNLKETVSDRKEINFVNTHKLDNIDSNSPIIDFAKVKICNSEELSTAVTVSNSDDCNSNDKVVDKVITNDNHSVKYPCVEINNGQNFTDSIKHNSRDVLSSSKDYSEHKSKSSNSEHEDIIQSKNASKTQFMQEEKSTSLVQNQNNLSKIKDRIEVTNEDHDISKPVIQIVDNNSMSKKSLSFTHNNVEDSNNKNEIKTAGTFIPRKKRSKETINTIQNYSTEENKQEEKESGRQKRKTARNAEEIIRKKYLNSDSDSSDSTEQLITVNYKLNHVSPSLKRSCPDNDVFNSDIKKMKMNIKSEEKRDITKLAFVEKFFQRNIKEKLPKLTQEELEELLIQKIAETITMRSEIGQLREQARISEKNQEVTRAKLQQLMKQVKDFEMVLNRNAVDRRQNSDKPVAPIKINRSVGLQVSFMMEPGMQNLRLVQQTSQLKPANVPSNINSTVLEPNNNTTNSRRSGVKIRSPRPVMTVSTTSAISQSPIETAPLISTVTPAALVVAKPLESAQTLTLSSQSTGVQPILSAPQQQIQPQPHQAIVLNGSKIQNQINRPIAPKPRSNDLIDLTDEEEKNKSNVKVTTVSTSSLLEQQLSSKPAQSFQRVIQTIPANVAIATQQASIRVLAPNQPAPTALVNNITPPRVAYVMQSAIGQSRQLLITSNSNQQLQIRPVTTCSRPSFSTVAYKTEISTIANGNVRLLTTPAPSNIQISKHPAPLPDIPNQAIQSKISGLKLAPPAPVLKISKVSNGIALSWDMTLSDKYADIASYQLYAYQEVLSVNPSTSLWKKIGDVRALKLPMACTLTQFSKGSNYYFAVRAVDTHGRKGQYSTPGNISM